MIIQVKIFVVRKTYRELQLINIIGPVLEKHFIYDSYACRKNKGTHFGIKRLRRALNANADGWVLKMDITGFFMNIDRALLWKRLKEYLEKNLQDSRIEIMLYLAHTIIFNDPTENCRYLCSKSKWKGLAKEKSLFKAKKGCGLPIGNLTSQVFANFYMSELDHYVKHDLKVRYYGRYVDDFYLVHKDNAFLKDCKNQIEKFVQAKLKMKINQRKTYLQQCSKGVKFLGVKIEKNHTNISKRTIKNFESVIKESNNKNSLHRLRASELKNLRSRVNSYLGIMGHYNTYRIRRTLVSSLDLRILKRVKVAKDVKKITI